MSSSERPSCLPAARGVAFDGGAVAGPAWAIGASLLHRVRRAEGAVLAVNLSLVVVEGAGFLRGVALTLVSVLVLVAMYAFNDLHDAPTDCHNPRKDQALIAAYLRHRGACAVGIFALMLFSVWFAFVAVGLQPALAAAGVLLVNAIYSAALKGVPVIDVAWCGLWGGLYAAITGAALPHLVLVGLMTSVCHLYQTLADRAADAASGITTTAVHSEALSRNVLVALSVLLVVVLWPMAGPTWAATAFVPLLPYRLVADRQIGWLLVKAYFGVVWLYVLGWSHAAG